MYREGNKDDAFELEKRLSELERQAAEIIQRAIDTFATPGNVLRLHRGDRDCLRKFFFLMKYRNRNLHQRYGHDSLDTYKGEDKEILADYMKRKGFRSPRDVWLANIHAFLSLEMDPDLKWIPKIQSTAYQLDAIRFILHAQGSFTAFCTPASPSQEFVLTENSYGVFEGPTSPLIDPESGAILGCLDLEYHTFAPISPRLIIVFRSFLLGDVVDDGSRPMRALLFDLLRQLGTKPDQARSLLHDLPVEKCHNSYSTVKDGKAIPVRGYKGLRSSDVFFFKCFPLAAGHVDLINEIFLEQAWATKRLAFGSRAPTQQTIRTYLRDGREGFKIITDASDDPRARYLRILEKALAKLGGPAVRSVSKVIALPEIHMSVWVALKVREELRQKRADLYEIYKMLKPGTWKPFSLLLRRLTVYRRLKKDVRL